MCIHKTTPFHRMESNRSRSEVFLSILTNWRGDIFTKYALFTGKIFLGNSICDNHLIFSMSPQQFGLKLLQRSGNILPCLAKKPLEGFFLGENQFSCLWLYNDIHNMNAMHLRIKMGFHIPISGHLVRRQNFARTLQYVVFNVQDLVISYLVFVPLSHIFPQNSLFYYFWGGLCVFRFCLHFCIYVHLF